MKGSKEGRGKTNVICFQEAVAVRRPKSRVDKVVDRVAQLMGDHQNPRRVHGVITLKVSIQVPVGLEQTTR